MTKQVSSKSSSIQGDITNKLSLKTALKGVYAVFAVITPALRPLAFETDNTASNTSADVCITFKVFYIISSTLPSPLHQAGKCIKVTPFNAQAHIETYTPIQNGFFAGGFFMENFLTQPFFNTKNLDDGMYALPRPASPKTLSIYLDANARCRDVHRCYFRRAG
ncbi:hypothetical protein DL95DRAFT_494288 [Leptodontidium sp. 2 PMI_412]|nr:hypothetical protein DL95DRAFT_494288 [Leptodontidium sp. 2 PMI_412]